MKNNYRHRLALAGIFALFFTYNSPLLSQNLPQKTISGIITSGADPLIGVNVLVKNSARGSISDLEGRYSVIASANDTLVFTYVGYKTQEVAVGNTPIINVVMEVDAQTLDAVVINAGYYKVSDREKTGSISRVTAEEIVTQPVNNPLAALQGRVAGVDIVETTGNAGGGFNVRIRGLNSLAAGNDPLYIIDGVPFDSRSIADRGISAEIIPQGTISPLNAINPANIESIEILKDADATAIYGSRGANGVILITTKKGKEGKTVFTVNSSAGIAMIAQRMNLLNTNQYLEMRREAFSNDGITEYPDTAYDVNGTWDQNRYTDWQEALIGGTARTQNLQASISGGSAQTQFLLSGNYQQETSVFPGDFKYNRANVNSNVTHKSEDNRFNVLFNVAYAIENNNLPKKDLTYEAITLPPNAPALYDESGEINWENGTWTNPLAELQSIYKNKSNTLLANAAISYRLFKNFETKINMGYGNTLFNESYIRPHTVINPSQGLNSGSSRLTKANSSTHHFIVEPQLEWTKSFTNFKMEFLVGTTFQKNTTAQQGFLGVGFPDNSFIENLQAATTITVTNEAETVYSYQSFFSRINLGYKDKLFLNLTGRRDGSSRFGPGNKYGNFGAIGAAWLFSEDLPISWLSLGKLRGSYGITGNDQIGDYQYLQSYLIGENQYDGNIGLEPARLYNPNFKWEENKKAEVAIELGLWKNRIYLNLAYYQNRSSNQLIDYALPGTTGFTSILANLDAVVENKGFEVELESTIVRNENFSWNIGGNLTLPKTTLLKFPGLETSTYSNRFEIGEPLTILKLYKVNGIDPETGLFTFEDFNGDGEITSPEDRQYIADLSPKFYGGISNSFQYKNWGLNLHFQFVKKDAVNQYYYGLQPGTMYNQSTAVLDRWQTPGDNAFMQQFSTGNNFDSYLAFSQFSESSGAISDASFIRLKNLELAYSLPLANVPNTSCRISVRGQNLLTFTKFKGGDPERTIGYLPSLRRISLNLQLQF